MEIKEITAREVPAHPWAEGDNIPWNDPDFSERMLREHLSQDHDLASRRAETIDAQVAWIQDKVLADVPTRVLDLACGPGLYTSRLARLGHSCVGIDYGPAAIRHAREISEGLDCTYALDDLRTADYGAGFGLAMLIFGQSNVFRRQEARAILEKAFAALDPGGALLLEPQRYETVAAHGQAGPSWYSCGAEGGLFSPAPHLCLTESFWDAEARVSTQRFYILDAATGAVTRHALSNEAYTEDELRNLLQEIGFGAVEIFPSLVGVAVADEAQAVNFVMVARR